MPPSKILMQAKNDWSEVAQANEMSFGEEKQG